MINPRDALRRHPKQVLVMSLSFMSPLAMSFSSSSLSFFRSAQQLAKSSRFLTLSITLSVLACCLSVASPAQAQLQFKPKPKNNDSTDDGSGSSTRKPDGMDVTADQMPPEKLFRMMLNRIRKNEVDINHLYSTMPIGFPKRQKEQMDLIDKLTLQTNQLKAGLPRAAIEAFKAAPGEDAAATQFVFRTLREMIDPKEPNSVFDPKGALEIVDTLIDAGADQDVVVLSKGFRSSFALDDFDRAELMLDRISDANPDGDLSEIRELVEDMKEKWQRELMLRRLEKNNDNLPRVKFSTTAGDFVVALYEDHAPNTVANFISLVKKNFYNDLVFHYVKPGEYIHTGCPDGDGSGGPGYAIESEFDREQIRHFFTGTLGMANTGPGTEGSQFVITHQAIPQLNGQFTAFGRVIEGFDVIRTAKAIDPRDPMPIDGVLPEPIQIVKAEVIRTRDHEYEPQKIAKTGGNDLLGGIDNPDSVDGIFGSRPATEDMPSIDSGGLFSPSNP